PLDLRRCCVSNRKVRPRWLVLAILFLAASSGCGGKPADMEGSSREEARARLQTVNNLKMMALALMSFHGDAGHLPPVDGSTDAQDPKLAGLSWRAYLLRRMDSDVNALREQQVYANLIDGKYPPAGSDPAQLWDRPALKTIPLHPFKSPFDEKVKEPWETFF